MFYMPQDWQQQQQSSIPRPNSQPGQTNPNPSHRGRSNVWGNNTRNGKLCPPVISLPGYDRAEMTEMTRYEEANADL